MPDDLHDVGLQEFIYQVKRDLLAPNPMQQASDPYPLFVIDKIELEVRVQVARGRNGEAKVTVLGATLGGGGSVSHERGTIVRISLAPLVSAEELAEQARASQVRQEEIQRQALAALVKTPQLPPEESS